MFCNLYTNSSLSLHFFLVSSTLNTCNSCGSCSFCSIQFKCHMLSVLAYACFIEVFFINIIFCLLVCYKAEKLPSDSFQFTVWILLFLIYTCDLICQVHTKLVTYLIWQQKAINGGMLLIFYFHRNHVR